MSCEDTGNCPPVRERVRYFPRQLLGVADMLAEQEHRLARMRWHNRMLHGWGVVCGLEVVVDQREKQPRMVTICPGYAISPQGDEIILDECIEVDVTTGAVSPDPCATAWPCPPTGWTNAGREDLTLRLAIRLAECETRPVRLPPGCGCDEGACDMSRIRSVHEVKLLPDLPQSHIAAAARDAAWRQSMTDWRQAERQERDVPLPVPPCGACPPDPWVVLATLVLSEEVKELYIASLSLTERRVLWPVWAIQALAARD